MTWDCNKRTLREKLDPSNFYRGFRNYRVKQGDPMTTITRLSYESDAKLYDVTQYPFGTLYEVNNHVRRTPLQIHREILDFFNEKHILHTGEIWDKIFIQKTD
jgi:hypothetical protein